MWILLVISSTIMNQGLIDEALESIRPNYNQEITTGRPHKADDLCPAGPVVLMGDFKPDLGYDDIVIGDVPNETLRITGYFFHEGDITVINDGVLIVENADFNLDGNISVANLGKATFDSSDVNIIQHYIYHHILFVADSAYCSITNSHTAFNGYVINFSIAGSAAIVMQNVTNDDFITAVVQQNATATLKGISGYTGEWLFANDCNAQFNNVDFLLTWYFFGDSSVVDFDFPEGDTIYGFYFDSTMANVSGIGYHVEIDSATNCMWATIPLKGCSTTIRNSDLRVTGIMFEGADTFSVSGLVNGLHYNDWVLPVSDRYFRLLNTTLGTWNLYPAQNTNVDLSSSIFGELCGFDSSYTMIQNAFCDGTGGHLEANHNAFLIVGFSSIFADVITKQRGICILAYCSMPYGRIWATSSSVMLLLNTTFPEDPIPADTAIVFVAAVTGPSSASTEDTVAIMGSAWIDVGPYQTLDFDHYRLYYREINDSVWNPVGDSQFTEVRRDTLDYWITVGLQEGDYEVRLILKDSAQDSVDASKSIRLRPIGIAEEVESNLETPDIIVKQVGYRLLLIEAKRDNDEIYIYDVMGRQVYLFKGKTYWHAPSAGVFYLKDRENRVERKVVVY